MTQGLAPHVAAGVAAGRGGGAQPKLAQAKPPLAAHVAAAVAAGRGAAAQPKAAQAQAPRLAAHVAAALGARLAALPDLPPGRRVLQRAARSDAELRATYLFVCTNAECSRQDLLFTKNVLIADVPYCEQCGHLLEILDEATAHYCRNGKCADKGKYQGEDGGECRTCGWALVTGESHKVAEVSASASADLTKRERVLAETAKRLQEKDSSGHGKGKKINAGHSKDRHEHGQKRKVQHKGAKQESLVAAYEDLLENEPDSALLKEFAGLYKGAKG